MSYVQLSEGGFKVPGGLPPRLVVPVLRSCQSPIRIWLVNYLHLHLHLHIRASIRSTPCSAYNLLQQSTLEFAGIVLLICREQRMRGRLQLCCTYMYVYICA